MGRIQIPVSLGGANHLSITLICPPATDNKILLSTLINISPNHTKPPIKKKREQMPRAIPNLRNNEDRGISREKEKGKRRFSSGSSLRGGEPKTPSHLEEEEISRNATLHSARPVRVESRMRGVFIEGHVSLPTSLALSPTLGGILQPPPSCFFSSRDTSRGFPFAVPPPFTQGWIRFRRMKSPGGLDFATHRSLHIYIYIYV